MATLAFVVAGLLFIERVLAGVDQRDNRDHAAAWELYVLANHARELQDADREVAEQRAAMSQNYTETMSRIAVAQGKCECPRCTRAAGKRN